MKFVNNHFYSSAHFVSTYNIEENKALLKYKKGYIIYSVMYIERSNVLKK